MLKFESDQDRESMLDQAPCTVQGHNLNIRIYESGCSLTDIDFKWI